MRGPSYIFNARIMVSFSGSDPPLTFPLRFMNEECNLRLFFVSLQPINFDSTFQTSYNVYIKFLWLYYYMKLKLNLLGICALINNLFFYRYYTVYSLQIKIKICIFLYYFSECSRNNYCVHYATASDE